jgi:hypothetical protein
MKDGYADGIFSGLPFFLQDMRPQGYLGRAIARDAAPRLGGPQDIRRWNDDDILSYFLADGSDLPGDLVVGDRAFEQALRSTETVQNTAIAEADRSLSYPERASAAQRGALVGSSAGGEQPKFLTTIRRGRGNLQAVLVKFSAADPSPVSQRWADLLWCEHLAAETMRVRQIACAPTEILDFAGRRFLEVERFDRIEAMGRRGLISLGAIEDAFLEGDSPDWTSAAAQLEEAGLIVSQEGRTLRWTWCFGDLIANSDMHRANTGFWFDDDQPHRITPSYDMLPMLYAPDTQGELVERNFAPRPPLAGVAGVWGNAAGAALEFWDRAAAEAQLSDGFREIAGRNRVIVRRLLDRFG